MNADEVAALRAILDGTALAEQVIDFAAALGGAPHPTGGLLLVGTPTDEPWHFAAHLTDEAQWSHRPELAPTLVRWEIPAGAPAHLAVSLERLETVARSETLMIVAPTLAPEPLLERVADARRAGALVLALEHGDRDLAALAHEALDVPESAGTPYMELVQHLVSAASPTARKPGVRARLGRWLDRVQGAPAPPH